MNALLFWAIFLLARPAAAQADEAVCREALAVYRAHPTVRTLEPLFACIDSSSPKLRAEIFDKIVCREIWDDPAFDRGVVARLRTAGKPYDRGSAVFDPAKDTLENLNVNKFVSGMNMWLHNWEWEIDPQMLAQKRREEAAHQRRMGRSARSVKFRFFQLGLMLFFYLVFIVKSTWRSRRLRAAARGDSGPGAPPGVKVI